MSVPSPAKTSVREATPDDLDDVARLLSARDGMRRQPSVVGDYLWGLDPQCTRTWLAYVGEVPVGLTMLYLRDMRWPQEEGDPLIKRAGYWAHLYVEPEYRKQMIYPQLVLSMLRGLKSAGIELIFTGTRQPTVAEGHQKLGFALVGKKPLRLRPLRPFRLLAKHKGFGGLAACCSPLDGAYRLISRLISRRSARQNILVTEVSLDDQRIEQVVELLDASDDGLVRQRWTVEQFRRRFCRTLDGTDYRISIVIENDKVVAALILAMAKRGNNIRAGVVLDIAALSTATAEQFTALLADAEQFAHRQGAEVMLALESSLSHSAWGDTYAGYWENHSEEYHMLVYPKPMAESLHLAAQLERWYFSFADHDAF